MSKQHLKLSPYDLHEHVWLYEDSKGLIVVAELRSGKTEQLLIPVSKVRGYINRKDKPNHPKE